MINSENDADVDLFQLIRTNPDEALAKLSRIDERYRGGTLLHHSIAYGAHQVAVELIRRGIDVNMQDSNGQSALHFAAESCNVTVAELLIQHGGRFDLLDVHGNSPVWTAVFNARGNYELVRLFLKHGGARMVKVRNRHGRSPLDFAVQIGDQELINCLSN